MNYLVNIAYDGTTYHGWAKQKNNVTIQETIEKCLEHIYKRKISIVGSGRTDTKVHAINQFFSFNDDKLKLTCKKIESALKTMLPKTIVIKDVKEVNKSFHACHNAISKTYLYVINCGDYDLFKNNYLLNYCKSTSIAKLKIASRIFIGEHDFKSFSKSDLPNTVRTIESIKIIKIEDIVEIEITGNGFLRNMVRMIVASLLDYSENKKNIETLQNLLYNPKKGLANNLSNPSGLYLKSVKYNF